MITISAKELRINLSGYLKRVMEGEEIEVIYRSKSAVKIQPVTNRNNGNSLAVAAAMRAYHSKTKVALLTTDPSKSTKGLYHDMLDNDRKYQER